MNNPSSKSVEAVSTIYLMSARKQWDYGLPKGWKEVAWQRFEYVECGVFEKPTKRLTAEDKELLDSYGDIPEGWIQP